MSLTQNYKHLQKAAAQTSGMDVAACQQTAARKMNSQRVL